MIQVDEHIFQMGWFNHQLDQVWIIETNQQFDSWDQMWMWPDTI